ncbi:MAG: hypothetical protein U0230_02970 [Polyangiales bacterium]
MILARCPACGAPHQLSLATEALSCACGHRGPLEPDVEARLRVAREVLFASQARERQLSALSRRLLEGGRRSLARFLVFAALLLAPFLCCGGVSLFGVIEQGELDVTGPLLGLVPLFVLASAIALGARTLSRTLETLRLESAALPPELEGSPPRCSYCGGPLAVPSGTAVVRCGFCASDNVADPTTVAWAASRRGTALESTAEVLHARAGVLATQGRRMRVAVLGAAVLGPVLACTLTCLLYFVLSTFEVGPHETLRYVLLETPVGRCVGEQVSHEPPLARVQFGSQSDPRLQHLEYLVPLEVPTFGARSMVGTRIHDAAFGDATVESVHGTPGFRENWVVMQGGPTGTFRRRVHEVCLARGSSLPGPPIVPPLPPNTLPSSRGAGSTRPASGQAGTDGSMRPEGP